MHQRAGVILVVIGYQHMHVNDSLKQEPDIIYPQISLIGAK